MSQQSEVKRWRMHIQSAGHTDDQKLDLDIGNPNAFRELASGVKRASGIDLDAAPCAAV